MPPPYSISSELPVVNRHESPLLRSFYELLEDFLARGGPLPPEYSVLNRAIRHLGDSVRGGSILQDQVSAYVREITHAHFQGTMQALALQQKYGYSGDFEIIDHIYTRRTSPDPALRLWDLFFHSQAAPVAVRNRKAYFLHLMEEHLTAKAGSPLNVLNVASGPARDVREFFMSHPEAPVHMDCVDMDPHAIEYARHMCSPWQASLDFHHRNVLRFIPTRGYDLTWSAGLFDYLSDRVFGHLLKAMMAVTKPGGEVVVGNFSDFNPSRDYMELLGHWQLIHRSRETLTALATQAGASPDRVRILWEPEGVNYFLHIRC